MSTQYKVGFLLGAVLAIAIGLVIIFLTRKKSPGQKYDERQIIGRGKAFQAGFFTLLAADGIITVAEYLSELPGTPYFWHLGALFVGITVFALTAIHFDAYLSMTESPKRFYIMGACFFVAMMLSAVGNLCLSEELNYDVAFMNIAVAIMWLIIIVALLIHNRRKAAEDE